MFAALNILFCFLVPCLFALGAIAISLSALRRHISNRQLLFTAFILVASVSSVTALYQALSAGDAIPVLPLLLIGFSFMVSIAQFATASFFGALGRLRQKMA